MPITLDGTNGITAPTYGGADTAEYIVPVTGFKNRIINGAMVIDQRNAGASQTINNTTAYTVDRWYVGFTGGSGTSQRVAGTGGFQNAIRMTGGSGITSAFVGQKIESFNSADLADNTVTVSFRASSSTLTSITWYARFPTAVDNYASVTAISNATINITSTPTNYTFSFACPSGVTNGLEIFFLTGAFTSGTLDITGVQLEKGSTATSFDYRPYGTELALCQRYFSTTYNTGVAVGTASNPGAVFHVMDATMSFGGLYWALPVKMRATPTTVSYSTNSGASGKFYTNSGAGDINAGIATPDFNGMSGVSYNVSNVSVIGSAIIVAHFTASAEL